MNMNRLGCGSYQTLDCDIQTALLTKLLTVHIDEDGLPVTGSLSRGIVHGGNR
jgi:hypothetical protein